MHSRGYLEAVRAVGGPGEGSLGHGLGTFDVPTFAGMHAAAARVVGATLAAVQAVHSGRVQHAVNLGGGLHHAHPDSAAGFCVYNDLGASIAWLLDQGVERVGYIDVDVHHGDGVQEMFWDDPRVLTISIHEDPRRLFPGTGFPDEIGGPGARGSAVNIALPAGTDDQGWLRAFHSIVPDVLGAFRPQFIVSQHGCDSHRLDPLAQMQLSIDGQRMSYQAIHEWAHTFADGHWAAVGGGGYDALNVVPRAWTHLVAEVVGQRISPATPLPDSYLDYVRGLGGTSPETMTDGCDPWPKPAQDDLDATSDIDAAILATRAAVYPLLGIEESHDWM